MLEESVQPRATVQLLDILETAPVTERTAGLSGTDIIDQSLGLPVLVSHEVLVAAALELTPIPTLLLLLLLAIVVALSFTVGEAWVPAYELIPDTSNSLEAVLAPLALAVDAVPEPVMYEPMGLVEWTPLKVAAVTILSPELGPIALKAIFAVVLLATLLAGSIYIEAAWHLVKLKTKQSGGPSTLVATGVKGMLLKVGVLKGPPTNPVYARNRTRVWPAWTVYEKLTLPL
jgi:hypothetical protein